jgi:hypothetical protein
MNKPQEISTAEWEEIMRLPVIRESWGIEGDETSEQFADMVYGVKFAFATGGPGYRGDLYMGLRGIVWVKNPDFEPATCLPMAPGKGPTATETPRQWHHA